MIQANDSGTPWVVLEQSGILPRRLAARMALSKMRRMAQSSPPAAGVTDWICRYLQQQKAALDSIPQDKVARLIDRLRAAVAEDRQIFVFGNGGSAANASHFATDLGKGSSDKLVGQGGRRRFRVLSINDNVSWITALGNDYAYEDVYVRQLENYARPGDFVLVMSVSGNSPNVVKAVEWAKRNGVYTAALVGGKRGRLAEIADEPIAIDSHHYGRVEDAHMAICHMLCYAFMEMPELGK
jgi:D-sedoheptulose 7-phosphate isomerase